MSSKEKLEIDIIVKLAGDLNKSLETFKGLDVGSRKAELQMVRSVKSLNLLATALGTSTVDAAKFAMAQEGGNKALLLTALETDAYIKKLNELSEAQKRQQSSAKRANAVEDRAAEELARRREETKSRLVGLSDGKAPTIRQSAPADLRGNLRIVKNELDMGSWASDQETRMSQLDNFIKKGATSIGKSYGMVGEYLKRVQTGEGMTPVFNNKEISDSVTRLNAAKKALDSIDRAAMAGAKSTDKLRIALNKAALPSRGADGKFTKQSWVQEYKSSDTTKQLEMVRAKILELSATGAPLAQIGAGLQKLGVNSAQAKIEVDKLKTSLELAAGKNRIPLEKIDMRKANLTNMQFDADRFAKTNVAPSAADLTSEFARMQSKIPSTSVNDFSSVMKNASVNADTLGRAIKSLKPEQVGKGFNVMGRAMGFLTAQALQALAGAIRQFFSQALEEANQYRQKMSELNFVEAVLSKKGMDITRKELDGFIKDIGDKYKFLSTLQVTSIVSTVADMGAEFSLTKEKILGLSDAISFISLQEQAYGMQVSDTGSIVNAALDGRSNFFNKLGINITKTAIKEKAYAMGILETGQAITKEISNQAAIALLIEQTSGKYDELMKSLEGTRLGVQVKGTKDWKDTLLEVGKVIEPLKFTLIEVFEVLRDEGGIKLTVEVLKAVVAVIQTLVLVFKVLYPVMMDVYNGYLNLITLGNGEEFKKAFMGIGETVKQLETLYQFSKMSADEVERLGRALTGAERAKIWEKAKNYAFDVSPSMDTETSQIAAEIAQEAEDNQKKLQDALKSLNEEILDSEKKLAQDLEDAAIDLGRKLVDIDLEYARKRADAKRDLTNKLKDIDRDYGDKVFDINRDYNQTVQDIQIEAKQEEEDAAREAHDNALQKEKEFQNQMQGLKEKFLMDLDDALHERDARQILKLIKGYNLEKAQRERDHALDMESEAQDIAAKKKQRQIDIALKLQQAAEDRAQKLADAELDRQRSIADAKRDYDEKLKEMNIAQARERADARTDYKRKQADLKKATQDRLNLCVGCVWRGFDLTRAGLEAILMLYRNHAKSVATVQAITASTTGGSTTSTGSLTTLKGKGGSGGSTTGGGTGGGGTTTTTHHDNTPNNGNVDIPTGEETFLQKVGDFFVDLLNGGSSLQPQQPVAPSAMPMSRIGSAPSQIFSSDTSQNANGMVSIALDLSPDLESRIVENTLNQTADIFVKQGRRKG